MAETKGKMEISAKIKYGNGIIIDRDLKILFDPIISDFISFVSHAHSDHLPNYIATLPITTKETKELAKLKIKDFNSLTFEYGKKVKYFDIYFTLYDANHILGSYIAYIELDGKTILYAPDFRLESFNKDVDILIIESTFGDPNIIFPDTDEVIDKLIRWIKSKEVQNKKIEIGAYALGKAQEVIKILNEHSIYPRVTKTIEKYNKVYEKFGIKLICDEKSKIIIRPMHETIYNPLPNHERAVVTGWAAVRKFENAIGFEISDHLDFKGLVNFINSINPKIIYTFHGFAEIFAKELRNLGYNAFSLNSL